jgi:hypothetical protein
MALVYPWAATGSYHHDRQLLDLLIDHCRRSSENEDQQESSGRHVEGGVVCSPGFPDDVVPADKNFLDALSSLLISEYHWFNILPSRYGFARSQQATIYFVFYRGFSSCCTATTRAPFTSVGHRDVNTGSLHDGLATAVLGLPKSIVEPTPFCVPASSLSITERVQRILFPNILT